MQDLYRSGSLDEPNSAKLNQYILLIMLELFLYLMEL